MCPPKCLDHFGRQPGGRKSVARRSVTDAPANPTSAKSFSGAIDLTHALGPDFPSFDDDSCVLETIATLGRDGYNMRRWHLIEHSGTHLDAPLHFSDQGIAAHQIPLEQLIVPLCVVDIRNKAALDPDAELTPDDLSGFEAEYGPVPAGACCALLSGWADKVAGPGFKNADAAGDMHFPGFHAEAAALLIERGAAGIAVDTLSLDPGRSRDFATHAAWLPSGRWGLEAVANLAQVPPTGATLVVGGPKIKGATGGPSRVFALF